MLLSSSRRNRRLSVALAVAAMALLLLAGCKAAPAPEPAVVGEPYPSLPDTVRFYLYRVQPFDSPEAILQARDRSAASLQRIVLALEVIAPPPEMQDAHEELLAGYRFILEGRELLESTHDNETVSEGFFLTDWGTMHLREHEKLIFTYMQNLLLEENPGGE